jgi:hypothetical protein
MRIKSCAIPRTIRGVCAPSPFDSKKVENPLLDNYSVNLDIVLFLVQATKANPFNWSQIRSLKQLLNGQWEAQS